MLFFGVMYNHGVGICFPDLKLQNSSSIADFSPNTSSTYLVNGVSTKGWFNVDYDMDFLQNIFLTQGIYSRTNRFDGNMFSIQAVEDVVAQNKPSGLWLNVQKRFVSQAWDFFSGPIVEINSYVMGGEIDGVITDFPATAASYKKSQCLKAKELPPYFTPALPGGPLRHITTPFLPPAEAPSPILTDADVSEPPLPPVWKQAASDVNATSTDGPAPSKSNAHVWKMAG